MKFSELPKEKKQVVILCGLFGLMAVAAGINFLLMPLQARWAASRVELQELNDRLEAADRLLRREVRLREDLAASRTQVAVALRDHLPDAANPLASVTQTLYAMARRVGVDIQSVATGNPVPVMQAQAAQKHRLFVTYPVRISAECGYDRVVELVRALETANPYLCVSGLTITGRTTNPEVHQVIVDVDWPLLANPDRKPAGPGDERG